MQPQSTGFEGSLTPFRLSRLLVPLDLSGASRTVLESALEFSGWFDARLDVVHVCAPLPFTPPEVLDLSASERVVPVYERFQRDAKSYLERLVKDVKGAAERVNETLVRAGEPAYEVLRLAEEGGYDLILMGTHGRTGLGRVLIGSVAEKISRLAKKPVLTFHIRTDP